LKDHPGEVVRLCLLKAHYRENTEYDASGFDRAQTEWEAMRAVMAGAKSADGLGTGGKVEGLVAATRSAFRWAMDDDLDTKEAVSSLLRATEALRGIRVFSSDEGRVVSELYRECGQILGLFQDAG
jgi:cysteinyl-tRNA synthetase